jgi:phosphatidylinositol-3-phosphatase
MRSRAWAATVGLVLATCLTGAAASARTPGEAATSGPCVAMTGTPAYRHVVVIMDENVGYSTLMTSSQAPYLHQLAGQCGTEAFMHAATHPSQVNYMAATSGEPTGVGVHTGNDNVFHQATARGDTWRAYEESIPKPCAGNSGVYKAGHNPPFWYDDLRTPTNLCKQYDVALDPALDDDIAADRLPTVAWVTPNACNDMHGLAGCPQPSSQRIAAGDAWLADLLPRLTAMPSYQAGQTLVIVTWDEGNGKETKGTDCTLPAVYAKEASCQIPTFVVSPYVSPGSVDDADHNLYGLLGDVEDILGYPRLGRAAGQPTLRTGLGF